MLKLMKLRSFIEFQRNVQRSRGICSIKTNKSPQSNGLICIRDLNKTQIKNLVNEAILLKCKTENGQKCCPTNKTIQMVIENTNINHQMAATMAANKLELQTSIINEPELFQKINCVSDLGRLLSSHGSDLILISTNYHSDLEGISNCSKTAVVNMGSCFQNPIEALTILMTLQEHYTSFEELTVAFIGTPNALLNSCMCSFPRVGINIRFACSIHDECQISPRYLEQAKNYCEENNSNLNECLTGKEAICNSDSIILFGPQTNNFCINVQDMKMAASNWTFIHSIEQCSPRTNHNLFQHKNTITFKVVENLKWMYAAIYSTFIFSN